MRKRGYPIAQQWAKSHWKVWDRLGSKQRLDYEQSWEDNQNEKIMQKVRGWYAAADRRSARASGGR
jgi:hypothetical protein